jgi:hypothetical protein
MNMAPPEFQKGQPALGTPEDHLLPHNGLLAFVPRPVDGLEQQIPSRASHKMIEAAMLKDKSHDL